MSEPVVRDLNQELRFPLWLLRTEEFAALRRASPLAVRVLLCVWAHGHGYRTICYPGEKRIAGLCKTSVSSVSALIRLVEQAGWLDVRRQRERGEGNVYRLQVPVTLRATADRIQAWLEGPVSGTEPAPVVEGVVMAGDLWGQAGKGRRRQRFARISLAEVNSDTWDLLWRTDSVAGHLWLMLQAYSASKEQLSLARLGRELKVRPSAVSSALARLRR
ncbi:MAG TPA: hypothetical protein PKY30_04470, partial [Myxococcota bacterium]|nr:hypothetical protein [Myxococcota bacterium]